MGLETAPPNSRKEERSFLLLLQDNFEDFTIEKPVWLSE